MFGALLGLVLALATLTRPEGLGVAAVGILWLATKPPKILGAALAGLALPLASYQAFRFATWGTWVSTSSSAKLGDFSVLYNIFASIDYFLHSYALYAALIVFALLFFIWARPNRQGWLVLSLAVPLILATAIAGGDHMPFGRFLVPMAGLLLLAIGLTPYPRDKDKSLRPLPIVGAGIAIVGHLAMCIVTVFVATGDLAAVFGAPVGRFLEEHLPAGSLVATATAGSTPYFAPSLHFIDTLGLNDPNIATRRIDAIRTRWQYQPGHRKGNGAYVLQRQPDVIILGPAYGYLGHVANNWFLTDLELLESQTFWDEYVPYAWKLKLEKDYGDRDFEEADRRMWMLHTGIPEKHKPEGLLLKEGEWLLIAFLRRTSPATTQLATTGISLESHFRQMTPEYQAICQKSPWWAFNLPCDDQARPRK
ncbi:MAG: hypothetical protein HN348_29700 [Proteobacteria bacterium]|nr:hypothetical protein [Pseudomonadota bacterium]